MKIRRVPTERFPPVRPTRPAARRGGSGTRGRAASGQRGGARALAGKRLAAAAYPIARRLDPYRSGIGPRDLLAAIRAAGVPLSGRDDGYMALYTALNGGTGLFERAERGRYVWLERPASDASG